MILCRGMPNGCRILNMVSHHAIAGHFGRQWLSREGGRSDESAPLPGGLLSRWANVVEKRRGRCWRWALDMWFKSGSAGFSVHYSSMLSSSMSREWCTAVWIHPVRTGIPPSNRSRLPKLGWTSFSVNANDAC